MCIQDNVVYIYSIISSEINNKSRIAIFPFSIAKNEFIQPSLDSHEYFNPWKVEVSDVDNDNNPEIILGVHKSTKYYEKEENRIFVFNRDKDYIFPKWLGSKVGNPIIDFKFDNVSKNLVILEESKETSKKIVVSYKWNGFGFDNEQILFEIDNFLSNIKDVGFNLNKTKIAHLMKKNGFEKEEINRCLLNPKIQIDGVPTDLFTFTEEKNSNEAISEYREYFLKR